jgi:hypothetical protein
MNKQIPMLFSPAMIEALLSGTKTETRRILKPQPDIFTNDAGETCDIYPFKVDGQDRSRIATGFDGHGVITEHKCSAEIDDLIWVKETHFAYGYWRTTHDTLTKTGKPKREFARDHSRRVHFDVGQKVIQSNQNNGIHGWYKRPSLFMGRGDSRLTLRVTSYSIERLHDITEQGAISEGCRPFFDADDTHHVPCPNGGTMEMMPHKRPIEAYQKLWNSINGTDAWDENPWVDVTKFEVIHRNVSQVKA